MNIASSNVFEVLSEKGVSELHHANSVVTACQFIRRKSLISRGNAERLGLSQSVQSSDDLDKRYSIWFDVFMDSVDIHNRAKRANVYGPVLFVFDINVINRNKTGRIWVTKENPTKWSNKLDCDRWFQSKKDLRDNFVKGRFDQMLVLRHCGGELTFGKNLKKIVLDDPCMTTAEDVDFYSMSFGALRLAMQDSGLEVPIERRSCHRDCACKEYWSGDFNRLFLMFDPKI